MGTRPVATTPSDAIGDNFAAASPASSHDDPPWQHTIWAAQTHLGAATPLAPQGPPPSLHGTSSSAAVAHSTYGWGRPLVLACKILAPAGEWRCKVQ